MAETPEETAGGAEEFVDTAGTEAFEKKAGVTAQCFLMDFLEPVAHLRRDIPRYGDNPAINNYVCAIPPRPVESSHSFVNKLNSPSMQYLVEAVPKSIMAELQPRITLYKVLYDVKSEETGFPKEIAVELPLSNLQDISTVRADTPYWKKAAEHFGADPQAVKPYLNIHGPQLAASLKSFTFDYEGVNPAEVDFYIRCKLSIEFASTHAFFHKYTHKATEKSVSFSDLIKRPRAAETSGIDGHRIYDHTNFRIKIDIKYTDPGDMWYAKLAHLLNEEGRSSHLEKIREALKASHATFFLNIIKHEFKFNTEIPSGPFTIDVEYIGAVESATRSQHASIITSVDPKLQTAIEKARKDPTSIVSRYEKKRKAIKGHADLAELVDLPPEALFSYNPEAGEKRAKRKATGIDRLTLHRRSMGGGSLAIEAEKWSEYNVKWSEEKAGVIYDYFQLREKYQLFVIDNSTDKKELKITQYQRLMDYLWGGFGIGDVNFKTTRASEGIQEGFDLGTKGKLKDAVQIIQHPYSMVHAIEVPLVAAFEWQHHREGLLSTALEKRSQPKGSGAGNQAQISKDRFARERSQTGIANFYKSFWTKNMAAYSSGTALRGKATGISMRATATKFGGKNEATGKKRMDVHEGAHGGVLNYQEYVDLQTSSDPAARKKAPKYASRLSARHQSPSSQLEARGHWKTAKELAHWRGRLKHHTESSDKKAPIHAETCRKNIKTLEEKAHAFGDSPWVIEFVYFGDLVNTIIQMAGDTPTWTEGVNLPLYRLGQSASKNRASGLLHIVLGVLSYTDWTQKDKQKVVSLDEIPIDITLVNEFWLKRVIKPFRENYPLRQCLRDLMIDLISHVFSEQCRVGGEPTTRIAISMDQLSIPQNAPVQVAIKPHFFLPGFAGRDMSHLALQGAVTGFRNDALIQSASPTRPSKPTTDQTREYIILQTRSAIPDHFRGKKDEDIKSGILHINIGAEGVPVRDVSFKKMDIPHYLEAKGQDAGLKGNTLELSEPYSAQLQMHGHTMWKPGQHVYIKLPHFGDPTSPLSPAHKLGLGGYFMINKVSNSLTALGARFDWVTDLECLWVSYGHQKKTKKAGEKTVVVDETALGSKGYGEALFAEEDALLADAPADIGDHGFGDPDEPLGTKQKIKNFLSTQAGTRNLMGQKRK